MKTVGYLMVALCSVLFASAPAHANNGTYLDVESSADVDDF